MAVNDLRNKNLANQGGTSEIQVGLTAANHILASGDPSATGGWVTIGYMEGGEVGPQRETEKIKDEADVLVLETTVTDEFIISNVVMQTDVQTLSLLDWLETSANAQLVRYRLDITQSSKGLTGYDQWVFLYNANVQKEDWRLNTSRTGLRTRAFTIVGTADGSGNIRAIVELPTGQGDAKWAAYAAFKDTAFP